MDPREHLRPDSEPYHQILERAAADWRLKSSRTHLLRNGLNHVYNAESQRGEPLIIRVTDGAHRQVAQIESELTWLDHLSRHDCAVPTPVRNANGELVETFEHHGQDFHVAMFEKIEGEMPLPNPVVWEQPNYQRSFGRMIGRVHRASNSLELPDTLRRGHWYDEAETMMPATPPTNIDPDVAAHMFAHQEAMRVRSAQANPRDYGLCHRDIHALNILDDGGKLTLLDFELGCYHWRIIDLAVTLLHHYYMPIWRMDGCGPKEGHRFMQNAIAGYREEHDFNAAQFEVLSGVMGVRETLVYILTKPEAEKWDAAIPGAKCRMTEQHAWFEQRWRSGIPGYDLDLSGI